MKILCVGGGSGGHVTPIIAVINQLKSESFKNKRGFTGDLEVRVWCDKKFAPEVRSLLPDVQVDVIASGKLRRYANLSFWYKWFSPWHIVHTHIPNLVDMIMVIGGFIQSLVKLKLWRPDIVFCKGGYVSLPVGLVAHLYHIPLVIHDSDTVPGLTNRVLAKYAQAIGTGAPVENYPSYPSEITKFVGIPVCPDIKHLSTTEKKSLKKQLGLDEHRPLVLAMGGGLGAVAINQAILANAASLIKRGCQIILISGRDRSVVAPKGTGGLFKSYQFTDQITAFEQAADIVITRAGATTMAELAAVQVATIIIPSPYLAGDHQTKNAQVYEQVKAAVVLNEFKLKEQVDILDQAVANLLGSNSLRQTMANELAKFARLDALDKMVEMIWSTAKLDQS